MDLVSLSLRYEHQAYTNACLQVCQSGDLEGEAAMGKAARQLERLAVEAVAACEAAEAHQVWLLAFEKLAALGSSSKKLIQALLRQLTGMRQGPIRVCLHSTWPPCLSTLSFLMQHTVDFLFCYTCTAVLA